MHSNKIYELLLYVVILGLVLFSSFWFAGWALYLILGISTVLSLFLLANAISLGLALKSNQLNNLNEDSLYVIIRNSILSIFLFVLPFKYIIPFNFGLVILLIGAFVFIFNMFILFKLFKK